MTSTFATHSRQSQDLSFMEVTSQLQLRIDSVWTSERNGLLIIDLNTAQPDISAEIITVLLDVIQMYELRDIHSDRPFEATNKEKRADRFTDRFSRNKPLNLKTRINIRIRVILSETNHPHDTRHSVPHSRDALADPGDSFKSHLNCSSS